MSWRHQLLRKGDRVKNELNAEVTGTVWKITADIGDVLDAGSIVMILESMKMEIPVVVEDPGTLIEILVKEGEAVTEGQSVASIEDNR
jgi:acetyl-CoA carboxylase biotin carboxyl carrier protein